MNDSDKANARARAEIEALCNRQLSAAEWHALLSIPISDEERAHTLELVSWFTRRYPTAAKRLAYVRRAHAQWVKNRRA